MLALLPLGLPRLAAPDELQPEEPDAPQDMPTLFLLGSLKCATTWTYGCMFDAFGARRLCPAPEGQPATSTWATCENSAFIPTVQCKTGGPGSEDSVRVDCRVIKELFWFFRAPLDGNAGVARLPLGFLDSVLDVDPAANWARWTRMPDTAEATVRAACDDAPRACEKRKDGGIQVYALPEMPQQSAAEHRIADFTPGHLCSHHALRSIAAAATVRGITHKLRFIVNVR